MLRRECCDNVCSVAVLGEELCRVSPRKTNSIDIPHQFMCISHKPETSYFNFWKSSFQSFNTTCPLV